MRYREEGGDGGGVDVSELGSCLSMPCMYHKLKDRFFRIRINGI